MIRVIAAGKAREKWMQEGIAEYVKRISGYDKIEVVQVADIPAPESNSAAQNAQVIAQEGERLLRQIRERDYVILLDLAGTECGSVEMAEKIGGLYSHGDSRIDFVIGGSLGVSPALQKRADYSWKLSACTFPHQLCRLIVLEQIYRFFRILHHEPYHK